MFDHFNLIAPIYERMIPPPDAGRLKELLRLPVRGRLLDAGGGTGRVSSQLKPYIDELVLTDVSIGMLRKAHEKRSFEVSMAHAENLPFAIASFERILVVDALHHFCNQEQAIADMVRVLKPGGRLVIEEPDLNHFSVKMIAVAEKVALMRSHFNYPREIRAMLVSHGLNVDIEVDETITAWIIADK